MPQCKWINRGSYSRGKWCTQCSKFAILHPETREIIYLHPDSTWGVVEHDCSRLKVEFRGKKMSFLGMPVDERG